jgi:hypothetical protein
LIQPHHSSLQFVDAVVSAVAAATAKLTSAPTADTTIAAPIIVLIS